MIFLIYILITHVQKKYSLKGLCLVAFKLLQIPFEFISHFLQISFKVTFKFVSNLLLICFTFTSNSFQTCFKLVSDLLQICLEICFKFQKYQEKTLLLKSLFSKITGLQPATLSRRDSSTGVFCKFYKISNLLQIPAAVVCSCFPNRMIFSHNHA